MPIEITIPRLGWNMEQGIFVEWLKAAGDAVAAGEPLFVMEGDKATQEIEAQAKGRLYLPLNAPQPGDTILVGAVIGYLLEPDEAPPPERAPAPRPVTPPKAIPAATVPTSPPVTKPIAESTTAVPAAPAVRRLARELGVDLRQFDPMSRVSEQDVRRAAVGQIPTSCPPAEVPQRNGDPAWPRITPRAARTAQRLGIDWTRLTGSGKHGRIRTQDLPAAVPEQLSSALPDTPGKLLPASPLRRAIARRLQESASQTIPVTITTKVNAAPLVALRKQLQAESPADCPSFNDLLIAAAARTLRADPLLNSCWTEHGIYLFEDIHVAVAVDTEAGLLTPVIRHADRLSPRELAHVTHQLAERARFGQCTQQELSGGTFTVTNLGRFGIDAFTPVINPPQAAILGVGRIVAEPVVTEGCLVPGQTLTLSLTFDHRVIDGAPAARWLQKLAEKLQSPGE